MYKWWSKKNKNKINTDWEYLKNKYAQFVTNKTYEDVDYSTTSEYYDDSNIENNQFQQYEDNLVVNDDLNGVSIFGSELSEFEKSIHLEKIRLVNEFNESIKKDIDEKAVQLMIEAMERNAENIVSSKFSFTIKLHDDSIKGKIIGKDGRNKKTFENITGTDLIIENDQKAITISSPNPVRREIAKRTMEKLLEIKNIEPNKIEKIYQDTKEHFDQICFEIGKETLESKLKVFNLDTGLYPIVGKLNFRTSYTQNVLTHSIECANLAVQIANNLNLDPEKAKLAAFFHDIGKAIDFELDNDHVNCGVEIARRFKLDDYILNAIESHHDKVMADNPYSAIVKIVDKLSASRPGARLISNENYFKRISEIEKICKSYKEIKEAYVLKSGKQIRIMVNPELVNDDDCQVLMHELKFKLEDNELINKQPIEIIMYREFVLKDKTKGSASRLK